MTRTKIGRNDPCPCGSGKKYKNCCLPKGIIDSSVPNIILGDAASLRMNYLLVNMGRNEFMRAYKGLAWAVEQSTFHTLSYSPDRNESEKALLLWKDTIEEEMKRLCSSHGKYFWLFLARRIFPETTEEYDRPTTPYLHRITFNLAILKYGKSKESDEFIAVPGSVDTHDYIFTEKPYGGETIDINIAAAAQVEGTEKLEEAIRPRILPRQITRTDAINIYQIEYLALHYYIVTAQLRRFWKGGKLKIQTGTFAGVALPKRLEKLVTLYDNRLAKYGELLSSFGSITGLEFVQQEESLDNFLLFVPVPNIERHQVPLVFPGEEFFDGKVKGPIYPRGNPSNYVLHPVSLRPFYEKMHMFHQAIQDMFGFLPEEIIAFLIALDRHHQSFWLHNIYSRFNFFQRGYTIMPSTEDFRRYLEDIYIEIYKHLFGDITKEQASSSFVRLLDWMTYKDDDFKRISLWDRTGVRLFLPVQEGLLTDHSAVPAVLESIFSELSLRASIDGGIGQVRGDDFQMEVGRYLRFHIPDFCPWICHRKLQFQSGLERDIDVSLVTDNVLIVVECKAFSVPPAFDRGEPSALQRRSKRLDTALNQVDDLCRLLSKECKGKNFELPQNVTHIISLVSSPFPEYIDATSDRYFLMSSLPRVCTPEEITEFIKQFRLSPYLSKPFVFKVS